MSGFVDVHSHVLYGFDDGAGTRDDSLAMLSLADEAGTTDIVATPHANSLYRFSVARTEERIAELSHLTSVRIHYGCDFHLQADNIHDALASPTKYTINHQRYLMVELPHDTIFSSTDEILMRLLDAGMIPVVTHPERNAMLQRRIEELAKWVELGCYAQVTAGSFLGTFGPRAKSCAHELFKRGLVHCVASDAHDTRTRPPGLQSAFNYLVGLAGQERVTPLFIDNPRAMLTGEIIDVDPGPVRVKRKWYQFW